MYHRLCETPKSPPGDYNLVVGPSPIFGAGVACETPKSPPGDYNGAGAVPCTLAGRLWCETPKSPPGDYNNKDIIRPLNYELLGVKHLNPRQGITTGQYDADRVRVSLECVKHLNPRQGITTNVHVDLAFERVADACETPKSPPGDYNE